MATLATKSSLPAKKRKSSLASTSISSSNSVEGGNTFIDANNDDRKPAAKNTEPTKTTTATTVPAVQPELSATNTTHSAIVAPTVSSSLPPVSALSTAPVAQHRLPSKKRRGSHDESVEAANKKRKGSHDLSVTFVDESTATAASAGASKLATAPSSSVTTASETSKRKTSFESSRKSSDASGILKMIDLCAHENLSGKRRGDSFESFRLDGLLDLDARRKASFDSFPTRKSSDASAFMTTTYLSATDSDGNDLATTAAMLPPADSAALDHLDVLGYSSVHASNAIGAQPSTPTSASANHNMLAEKSRRKESEDTGSGSSFVSEGQRLLLEAIMMTSKGESSHAASSEKQQQQQHQPQPSSKGSQQQQNFAQQQQATSSHPVRSTYARDRLESWGGMSDLSLPAVFANATAASLPPLQRSHSHASVPGLDDDIHDDGNDIENNHDDLDRVVLVNHSDVDGLIPGSSSHCSAMLPTSATAAAVPSRISLHHQRERFNSIASLSEASINFSQLQFLEVPEMDPALVGDSMQAYIAAAVASVGDQIAELAGNMEEIADAVTQGIPGGTMEEDDCDDEEEEDDDPIGDVSRGVGGESEASSVASPLIGVIAGQAHQRPRKRRGVTGRPRPRSWSVSSSGKLSVDLDAVQAAVDAAEAATGALGLTGLSDNTCLHGASVDPITGLSRSRGSYDNSAKAQTKAKKSQTGRRKLPTKRNRDESLESSSSEAKPAASSSLTEKEMQQIRRRARAAAGFAHTVPQPAAIKAPVRKRRGKQQQSTPEMVESGAFQGTPRVSNKTLTKTPDDVPCVPLAPQSMCVEAAAAAMSESASKSSKAAVSQKWDGMYQCLLDFVEERKEEETKHMSHDERESWTWDGNVPTTYKTKDGKALGRWVNNQRSSYTKGTLKDDREELLTAAGLKWSVLTNGAWNEMFEELRVYIEEQTRGGEKWDGNVPTNYQIKSRPNSNFQGEDKNLGRWVNRQRSMFQAGRLRRDRQDQLEEIGLKWCMLASTTWDSMFESLVAYIQDRQQGGKKWDGNVPANFKTDDDPPRALGRWINRQRSAYVKKKLKKEYVDKLSELGLKWSVHDRTKMGTRNDEAGSDSDSSDRPFLVKSMSRVKSKLESTAQSGDSCTPDDVGSGGKIISRSSTAKIEVAAKEEDRTRERTAKVGNNKTSAERREAANVKAVVLSAPDAAESTDNAAKCARSEGVEREGSDLSMNVVTKSHDTDPKCDFENDPKDKVKVTEMGDMGRNSNHTDQKDQPPSNGTDAEMCEIACAIGDEAATL